MKLRTIIADDEPLARERIRALLGDEPDVEIVADCEDGHSALAGVIKHRPDLLFLDVQMPGLNGFEVLEAAGDASGVVIFTTAHDQYAIRAFEANAVDYLLKPYSQSRFTQALARARLRRHPRPQSEPDHRLEALLSYLRTGPERPLRILVRLPDRILFVRPQEVDYVLADGNYVHLHVGKARYMVRETMASMENRLASAGFMRVSRSSIVNLDRVREVKTVSPGAYSLVLHDGTRIEMTCPFKDIQERLARA